jgi:hypothetical protein
VTSHDERTEYATYSSSLRDASCASVSQDDLHPEEKNVIPDAVREITASGTCDLLRLCVGMSTHVLPLTNQH